MTDFSLEYKYLITFSFTADVQLKANTTEDWPYLENVATKERPLIVHANGPSKLTLNHLGNYLAKSWSVKEGCALCKEKKIDLNVGNMNNLICFLIAILRIFVHCLFVHLG